MWGWNAHRPFPVAKYRHILSTSSHCLCNERFNNFNFFCSTPVDKPTFLRHLWSAYNTLAEKATDDAGKPAYFRFLTLLAFLIFLETRVDVAILEVGLGGRLDATNCIRSPAVCGVTPLGFDHMELLGHTLPEIAREKAGIFKPGRPAFTVNQRADAQEALREVAARVGAPLSGVRPLEDYRMMGPSSDGETEGTIALGLAGEHQRQNAALAVALAASWEAQQGREAGKRRAAAVHSGVLPPEYIAGLQTTQWPGRGQIVEDYTDGDGASKLTFFLDGAHTPESLATCATWFADAVASVSPSIPTGTHRVLIFNCMQERDPAALLTPLASTLASRDAFPTHALFVPPESSYMKLGGSNEPPDLKWQINLRQVWQQLRAARASTLPTKNLPPLPWPANFGPAQDAATGAVLPSLRVTVDWLRRCVRERPSMRMQVLVTGSLYLVGDLLRLVNNQQEQSS